MVIHEFCRVYQSNSHKSAGYIPLNPINVNKTIVNHPQISQMGKAMV